MLRLPGVVLAVSSVLGLALVAPAGSAAADRPAPRIAAPTPTVRVAGGTATVRWRAPRGAASTTVEQRTAGARFRPVVRVRSGGRARVAGLRRGSRYGFRLVVRAPGGRTSRGRVVWRDVAGLAAAPLAARVALDGRAATVAWDAVPGVARWQVVRHDLSTGAADALPPVAGTTALDGVPASSDGHWIAYGVTAADVGTTPPAGRTPVVRVAGLPRYQRHVALGDSFSSGAGQGGVLGDAACGQSRSAWSRRLPSTLAPQPLMLACNAATIPNLLRSGAGGRPQSGTATQLDRAAGALGGPAVPTLVTVGIGGNDADVLGLLGRGIAGACRTEESQLVARVRGPVRQALDRLFAQLRELAPGADVLALPYPRLLTGSTGMGNPLAMFALGGDERDVLGRVLDALNAEIAASAAAHGVAVSVDAIRSRFDGHLLGADVPYFDSMPLLEDPLGFAQDLIGQLTGRNHTLAPLHPNDRGTAAQAAAGEQALRGFAAAPRSR